MQTKYIVVSPYDPKWVSDFAAIKREIEGALDDLILRIEHVGSTSVKGLSAKPIIDIDVVMKDYSVFDEIVTRLAKIGYQYEGDLGIRHREAFRYQDKLHLQKHHLYVCPQFSEELHRHITFRDYLRTHAEAVQEYSEIKEKAAELFPENIEKYIEYKSSYIEGIYAFCGLK